MAKGIKGITIEIGGNTGPLDKALSGVNQKSKDLQGELRQVERLLKFDPGNAELVAQKQEILAKQVEETTKKLDTLKQAQAQVEAQFASGRINEEQYRAFQREIVSTEQALTRFKTQMSSVEREQQQLESKTSQLNTLFRATKTDVDKFADVLGSDLTNAIKNGTASSKQLDTALDKIGKAALGSSIDVDKMKAALKTADDGASLKAVRKDLSNVAKEAKNAGDEVNNFGTELGTVIAGLAAGGGISGAVSAALDSSRLKTKIDISMEVPEESKQSVREAINTVTSYEVDAEAALEGVRRQWALNKDATDEANTAVVTMAGTIANAFSGVDFTELIQEGNEIAATLGITNEEALGLVNTLLDAGFPPEQIDIIAEYGDQMIQAGFSAKEVQGIFAAGVDTKSWNIDNLLDGVKEGRIQMADFGNGLDKSMTDIISQTDISAKQFVGWGQAIAKGGEGGQAAMLEATKALAGVEDATVRNQLGTKMFGTLWEDQGKKIVDTIINAEGKTQDLATGVENVNAKTERLNQDPTVAMRQGFAALKLSLEPVFDVIGKVVGKIAEWISNNPTLAATIAAVVSGIGILVGICMGLAPILISLAGAAGMFGIAMGPLALIIGGIVLAIGLLVAAGIAIYKNWDEISKFGKVCWDGITAFIGKSVQGIVNFFKDIGKSIDDLVGWFKKLPNEIGTWLTNTLSKVTTWASNMKTSAVNTAKNFLSACVDGIKSLPEKFWTWLVNTLSKVTTWATNLASKATSATLGFVNNAINQVKTLPAKFWTWLLNVVSKVSSWGSQLASKATVACKQLVTSAVNTIKSLPSKFVSVGSDMVKGLWRGISSVSDWVIGKIKGFGDSILKGIKSFFKIKSPSQVFRDEVGKQLVLGLAFGITQNAGKAKKAAAELAQEVLSAASSWLDKYKVYHDISLQDEVYYWDQVRRKVKSGTDARIEADKKYLESKKSLTEQVTKLESDYANNTKKVNDDLINNINSLTDAYNNSVDSRTKAITSSLGLFEEFTKNIDVTGQQLLANLQTQVMGLSEWTASLEGLKNRGVSDGLIEELQQMGPKSSGEIQALLSLTNEELNQYVLLWQEKTSLAKTQALTELSGLKEETASKIQGLTEQANQDLTAYAAAYQKAMSELGVTIKQPINFLKTTITEDGQIVVENFANAVQTSATSVLAKNRVKKINTTVMDTLSSLPIQTQQIGVNVVQGIIAGIDSQIDSLRAKMAELINVSAKSAQEEGEIHSPSRLFARIIGVPLAQGVGVGFEDEMQKISLFDSIPTNLEQIISGRGIVSPNHSTSSNTNHYGGNTVIIQARTIDEKNIDIIIDKVNRKLGILV